MNNSIKHICVLIPAKNEELLLTRCLYSALAACDAIASDYSTDIILCVDASTDKTFELGHDILHNRGCVVSIAANNVGFARKKAAQIALERYQGLLAQCWIANTDADCDVPTNWLARQIYWANQGMHAVTGIVKVDSYQEHDAYVPYHFERHYSINSDRTHPHIHGANLGIRADIYQHAGGWNSLTTAEDHDLWQRLTHLKVPTVSDADLFVLTSGRKKGRAPHGFAGRLTSFNGFNHD